MTAKEGFIGRGATVVAALVGSLLLPFAAIAHDSWIGSNRMTDPVSGEWCCNHIDCAAIPAGGLQRAPGGYLVTETGETIPASRVIWGTPPDGAWWRCRNLSTNATRCLIGPPPGS